MSQLSESAAAIVYSHFTVPGQTDDGIFAVVEECDWLIKHLPAGTITFFSGYNGTVWLEDGRWVYSDFGDVCCSAHRPEGPDYGVYLYEGHPLGPTNRLR